MFVVADGMGGHSHGEVASRIAVKAIREFVEQTAENDTTWPFVYDARLQRHSNRLKTAIRIAHDKVLRAIRQDGSLHGMGTTVVGHPARGRALPPSPTSATAAPTGCATAASSCSPRTTPGSTSRWSPAISREEQARAHPLKNVVTRALGGDSEVVVDVREGRSRPATSSCSAPTA